MVFVPRQYFYTVYLVFPSTPSANLHFSTLYVTYAFYGWIMSFLFYSQEITLRKEILEEK